MSFSNLYHFLEQLEDNNSKEWMDSNRKYYHEIRDWYINWLDNLNDTLASIDKNYTNTSGRKAIHRINNNLMFHPDKPIYKNYFAAGLDHEFKQGDFYIEIGTKESLLAGGYWKPPTQQLKSIREAIDYNGEDFIAILNKPSFRQTFGKMINEDPLKKAPRGYTISHPYISLLRHKTFAVSHNLTQEDVCHPKFIDKVIKVYKEMLPFRRYLNKAITV